MAVHQVRVGLLPVWLDAQRLLGPARSPWTLEQVAEGVEAHAELDSEEAADLAARLRGLGFDGRALSCEIEPALRRNLVRRARTEDARRRRETTPGFERSGARVDEIGRMSLTPERLAMQLAGWAERRPVVDACCGVGGNAIAFARAGSPVVAIELDADRLALARHNARLYGVADRIEFVHGDARERLPGLAHPDRILFVDPPWGPPWGADWDRQRSTLADLPLLADLLPLASGFAQLWAKLPPSFATAELVRDPSQGRIDALFGDAAGDRRRIKFVLARLLVRA